MLLGLVVMWGSAFMLTKIAVAGIAPDLIAASRLLVASLLLLPAARLFAGRPAHGRKLWLFMLLIAVFGYALPFSLISWGQAFIASGLASILMAIMPLATLGLAHFLIPGERLTPYRVGGFILGFAGVVVLMGPSVWSGLANGENPRLPMLAVLGGAFSYAVSSVLARLRPAGDALFTGAATTSLAALMLLPLAIPSLSLETATRPTTAQITAVVLLGIVSTALAAILYFRLVKSAGPAFVSQLNYLIPPWAVGCGILFLGETLEPNHLYALGLILAGVLATHLERVRR
ncbi:EamA family transporter [Thiocystis violacea]|nr:DMT family transporter [Thiocystis violacea]MBK1719550.1 EamA family transporter [Thiocystis violacea]